MKKINILEVRICKMEESSGNMQFFVQLVRTDEKAHGAVLDYDCFQTKFLEKNECLERAWFSASMLARFTGLSSMSDVKLFNLSNDEIDVIKNALCLRW